MKYQNKVVHLSYLGESKEEKVNLFWGLRGTKKLQDTSIKNE